MSNVALFGLGAIGSVLAKYLLKNKKLQLYFFNRSEKTDIEVSFSGQIKTVPITINPSGNISFDWIIICLKTYHLADAKQNIQSLIGATTNIAVFRNGLRLIEDYTDLLPRENILPTIIDCPTQRTPNGSYLQLRSPKIILPNLPLAIAFQKLFTSSDLEIQLFPNFFTAQWEKLIESSSLGAILTVYEQPCILLKNDSNIRSEYLRLIREAITVARADGVDISLDFPQILNKKLGTYPDHKSSSMLTDRRAGRPLELDAKIGIIIRIAQEKEISVPFSEVMYGKLLAT